MARPPNIVWIFADQWRHDAFGFAGNRIIRTPHLDALAARGAVFTRAYCESPVCMPSRASLVTGLYPSGHGLSNNLGLPDYGRVPDPALPTVMRRLRDTGYFTAAVGKLHLYAPPAELGLCVVHEEFDKWVLFRGKRETPYVAYLRERGLFERWAEALTRSFAVVFGGQPGPPAGAGPDPLEPADTLDAFIGRQAERMIRDHPHQHGDQPLFLWVGFVGPHLPYDGPAPYASRYDPTAIPLGPPRPPQFPANRYGDTLRHLASIRNVGDLDPAGHRLVARHYYGAATLIDDAIGGIVRAVGEAGLDRDTWLLFSSDHGELLGDHGLLGKQVFYEAAVRVPQVVVPPVGAVATVRFDGLTQGFDLTATILDLASTGRGGHAGRSLLSLFAGGAPGREVVFSEITGFLMMATRRWKLVVDERSGEPQALYDLCADPSETQDLLAAAIPPSIVSQLMHECVEPFLAESTCVTHGRRRDALREAASLVEPGRTPSTVSAPAARENTW